MTWETAIWILAAGAATGIGGLFVLVVRRPSEQMEGALLGFTAGVMLAATSFSLLVPALELGTLAEVLAGLAAGGVTLAVADMMIPHAHGRPSGAETRIAAGRAKLLLAALTIQTSRKGSRWASRLRRAERI